MMTGLNVNVVKDFLWKHIHCLRNKSCSWSKWLFKHLFYEVHFSLQWLLFFIYFYISFNQKIKKKKAKNSWTQNTSQHEPYTFNSEAMQNNDTVKWMCKAHIHLKDVSHLKVIPWQPLKSHRWWRPNNLSFWTWNLTWILQAGQAEPNFGLWRGSLWDCSPERVWPLGLEEWPLNIMVASQLLPNIPKHHQKVQRCHLCHLHWCFSGAGWVVGITALSFWWGLWWLWGFVCWCVFLPSVSRSPGMESVVVSICCCIPASSAVDKLFHQPKITSSRVWTMKTLPTLVFSKRGTKGPKALPVCFMSVFLEKANPQCFQIAVLKSEGGRKRQKTTLGQNSTEQIKQAMHRFMSPHSISSSVPQ